jgi:hypothetical protein
LSIERLKRENNSVLLTMIVQHQNEESNSPTITNFTTIWADQNIDSSVVSGLAAACAATSAGFMLANLAFREALWACQARRPALLSGGVCSAIGPKLGLRRRKDAKTFYTEVKPFIGLIKAYRGAAACL